MRSPCRIHRRLAGGDDPPGTQASSSLGEASEPGRYERGAADPNDYGSTHRECRRGRKVSGARQPDKVTRKEALKLLGGGLAAALGVGFCADGVGSATTI